MQKSVMSALNCVSPIIEQPVYLVKDTAIGPGTLLSKPAGGVEGGIGVGTEPRGDEMDMTERLFPLQL